MTDAVFADRVAGITGSFIDQIMSLLPQRGGTGRGDVISFGDGSPGPDALPIEAFRKLAAPVFAEEACPALNYGPTEGDAELRARLLDLLLQFGVRVTQEQLVITSGGMQGLDLTCKLFVNPGDVVAVEQPAFTNALATITSYQGRLLPVPVDEEGMVVGELAKAVSALACRPKLIYTNPTFQNPSGATLSLERRHRLLELAETLGAFVLEDDPYAWLGYDGLVLPSLYELSGQAEWVVGVHTFSKTVGPGARVGWCVGSPEVIQKMVDAKQGMDTCTNMLGQRMIAAFLREERFMGHLAHLRRVYGAKRDAMCEALSRSFGDISEARWTVPKGGFFVWLTLPAGVDTEAMFTAALSCGVAYVPGNAFGEGEWLRNRLRLSFSRPSTKEMSEGVVRLRQAYDLQCADEPLPTSTGGLVS